MINRFAKKLWNKERMQVSIKDSMLMNKGLLIINVIQKFIVQKHFNRNKSLYLKVN